MKIRFVKPEEWGKVEGRTADRPGLLHMNDLFRFSRMNAAPVVFMSMLKRNMVAELGTQQIGQSR